MRLILAGIRDSPCRALSCRPFECLDQVTHLADVVIHVGGANEKQTQASVDRGLLGYLCHKGFIMLRFERARYHVDGLMKREKQIVKRIPYRVDKFMLAIADISRTGDQRSDVVVQIARQMQDEVADTVAVRERIGPKQILADRPGGSIDACREVAEIASELGDGDSGQFRRGSGFGRRHGAIYPPSA
jgi:hypothetical protein